MNVYESVLSDGSGKVEYSTSEKVIGTWINGTNLYQRTFTGTTASSSDETQITSWTSSYVIREFKGGLTQGSGVYVPISYCTNSSSDWLVPYVEGGKLCIGHTSNNRGKAYYLTVVYTK